MERMQDSDADEIAELEFLLFPDTNLNEASIRKEIAAGEGWVVREKGKIVAYLFGRLSDNMFDILRVGVHPKCQGRRLGTQLVDRVLKNYLSVMLTVEKANTRALAWYRRLGFQIEGALSGHAWVMTR